MGSNQSELSQDVAFDILSSPRRRYVLYYLRTLDEAVKLTDLAEQVAAWENDTQPEKITEQERKRVYVSLYQTHIPRLADAGIVDYDKESGLITLADDATHIDGYLDSQQRQFPWQLVYLAVATVGVALVGLTWVGVSVFAALSTSVTTAVVLGAFVTTAVVHAVVRLLGQQSVPPELRN